MIMDWALDAGCLREWALRGLPGNGPLWAEVEALRAEGRIRLWVSASTLSAASSTFGLDAAPIRHRISGESGRGLHPFTVDALSATEALADGWANWDAPMAYASFLRIAPEGLLVTRDGEALFRLEKARKPEQALADLKARAAAAGVAATATGAASATATTTAAASAGAAPSLPMLDLREEYRLNQGPLDRALLGAAAAAQYILGPQVARFEGSLAGYLGTAHAVGVSSGTEALVLALRALAIRRHGKERFDAADLILTTPFTFVATGDAILRSGATPLFVDIDPASGNLDLEAARRVLANPPGRVVGMIPVHLFGRPCDMDGILSMAASHGLFVLEDVAQAFGATWKGRKVGSLGDAAAFSFFPSKNLGGFGDAGAIATSDAGLAETASRLLRHGAQGKGTFDTLGYNARLDTLQAAVLLEKLPRLEEFNRARRAVAKAYIDGLQGLQDLALPEWPGEVPGSGGPGSGEQGSGDPGSHVFHQFTLRTSRRDALQKHLARDGIASMIYYAHPLHRMKLFEGRCVVAGGPGLPVAELAAGEVLSLPIGPTQGAEAVAAVISSVRRFFGG